MNLAQCRNFHLIVWIGWKIGGEFEIVSEVEFARSDHTMMIVTYNKKVGNWGDCVKWHLEPGVERILECCWYIAKILDTWEGRRIQVDWFVGGTCIRGG